MYENFFKFEKSPFKLVADPSMLFASHSVREALTRLEYAVKTAKGLVVMTGEVGTGKTTLVNRFLAKAGPQLQTAYVFNPSLTGSQLLTTLAVELGLQPGDQSKVDLTRSLYELLLANRQAGHRTVVFVDEAQIMSREALEELRLISNLETWQEKLLHIVLVGQPELLEKLQSHDLRQLCQRVELFIEIEPMTGEETRQYIEHRMKAANPLREVYFTPDAAARIHVLAGGVPRQVNKICDASLLVAFVAETGQITPRHVEEAIETIGSATRPPAPPPQDRVQRRKPQRVRLRPWYRFWASAALVVAIAGLVTASDRASGDHGARGGLKLRRGPLDAPVLPSPISRAPYPRGTHPRWELPGDPVGDVATVGAAAANDKVEASRQLESTANPPTSRSPVALSPELSQRVVAGPRGPELPETPLVEIPRPSTAADPAAAAAEQAVVHLASFAAAAAAAAYAEALGDQGRTVLVQRVQVGQRDWYRVYLGGFASLGEAEDYAAQAERTGRHRYAQALQVRSDSLRALAIR